jgi:hypothetical protein
MEIVSRVGFFRDLGNSVCCLRPSLTVLVNNTHSLLPILSLCLKSPFCSITPGKQSRTRESLQCLHHPRLAIPSCGLVVHQCSLYDGHSRILLGYGDGSDHDGITLESRGALGRFAVDGIGHKIADTVLVIFDLEDDIATRAGEPDGPMVRVSFIVDVVDCHVGGCMRC